MLWEITLVVAPAQGFAKDKDETEKAEKEKKEKEKKLPKKKDPDEIGNRDVGKGVNFYSLEKEIALGKQVAAVAERRDVGDRR